jgi:type III pantothenate kinase
MIGCIDFGNTRIKAAIISGGNIIQKISVDYSNAAELHMFLQRHDVRAIATCDVSGKGENILTILQSKINIHRLNGSTLLPFNNKYLTPKTLGADRIAAVAGAQLLFPNTTCMVIDCGTCMTTDVITADGQYVGGTISPGLNMRLRAMHEFTGKLPLVEFRNPLIFPGNDTDSCMLNGAFTGMVDEINGAARRYTELYGPCKVLMCGGDADLFAEHLNLNIFAAPDLVLFGLYQIYRQHDT